MTHCYTFSKHTHKTNPFHNTLLAAALMLFMFAVPAAARAQQDQPRKITFDHIDATKTYPEGNQITYVLASNLPSDKATIEALQKHIVSMMRVTRIFLYPEYGYFMFDGDADVNPQHIVDEMNEYLQALYSNNNENQETAN